MSRGDDNSEVIDFLKFLTQVSDKQRIALLSYLNSKQCKIIRQLAYNILFNSSINIASEDLLFLKKNSDYIKQIASKNICLKKKREVLVKRHLLVKRLGAIALTYFTG